MKLISALLSACVFGMFSASASAIIVSPNIWVDSTVNQTGSNSWSYGYTVYNNLWSSTGSITSFYLPYFSDAGVTALTSPTGWTATIETSNNVFGLAGAGAIQWSADLPANGIALYSSLSGFGFNASYAPAYGPFMASLSTGGNFLGDPSIPGSPNTIAAIPEPESYAMLLAGLGLIGFVARKSGKMSAMA